MSVDPYITKEKEKKVLTYTRNNDPILLAPQDTAPQKPSARNTPMLSFQPHHTEISTDRPSVSGRLLLHIPKLAGKRFQFVSLSLHLRLKESIAWSKQDLITFEIEKKNWSQSVWEKKISLLFQDRQVEEGDSSCVAIVKEPAKHNSTIEIAADEWRWEWLMPVTEHDICPESFEGSMGNIWYELEAKCMFRWDIIDKDGNVVVAPVATVSAEMTDASYNSSDKGSSGSSKKPLSLSSAFGKLRVGNKSKKAPQSGDFKVGSQHEEYIQRSLRMRNNSTIQANADNKSGLLTASSKAQSTPHLVGQSLDHGHASEPLPFLIRKVIKLYFIKPPPNTSPGRSFFLPPPSMALPTLPGTRRLKALIPGARIQVQIQIPSLIPIRGYAQTSQLVPDHKKGGLVISKHSQQHNNHLLHHQHLLYNGNGWEVNPEYLDNFQVALTVRKVTTKDMEKSDQLKRRYQGGINSAMPFASAGNSDLKAEAMPCQRRQFTSGLSNNSLAANNGTIETESGRSDGVKANTVPEKPWRKEIRVRKVKCEFWQKENCRIPTSSNFVEGTSRSIKYALGPAFLYSEKEQERERSRLSMQLTPNTVTQQQMTTAVSWDNNVVGGGSNLARKDPNAGQSLSPILKSGSLPQPTQPSSPPSSPLQAPTVPYASGRKGSNASLFGAPLSTLGMTAGNNLPRASISSPSKPFMLLIPVPLDSPKLRQTFTWPTADIPTPMSSKYNASSRSTLKSMSSGEGAYYPTQQALHQMTTMGTAADSVVTDTGIDDGSTGTSAQTDTIVADPLEDLAPVNRGHHQRYNTAASLRTRIEVKHYLSLRLSIDMLEFEGELDYDEEQDLEAMEEQQLQQVKNKQELSAYRPSSTLGTMVTTTAAGVANQRIHATSPLASPAINAAMEPNPGVTTQITPFSIAAANPTIQSAPAFLNSTAGLKDMDAELDEEHGTSGSQRGHSESRGGYGASGHHHHQSRPNRSDSASSLGRTNSTNSLGVYPNLQPPMVGAVYDSDHRRGSEASQTTVKSSNSSNSNIQSTSGGLIANAIGVIKKKASSSGLNSMMQTMAAQQPPPVPAITANAHPVGHVPRRPRSCIVNVQKLKDFVIRVPITVVIQVDDLSCVGTTAKTDSGDTATRTTETAYGSRGSEGVEAGWAGTEMERVVVGLGSECKSTTTLDSTDASLSSHSPADLSGQGAQMLTQPQQQQKMVQESVVEAFVTPANERDNDDDDDEYVEGQFMVDNE